MTQSTPVPEAVIEAAYSGEPLDNRPPEAMDGRTVQYIYSYGYSTGRSHAAEAVRRAALTSPPKAEAGEARWQDIASAPKDGTRILLAKIVGHPSHPTALWWVAAGHWSVRFGNWNDGVEPAGLADPTNWMPLPTPESK